MASTWEMSTKPKDRMIPFLKKVNQQPRNAATDVGCSQWAASNIWTNSKKHGNVQGKHIGGRPTKKRQDRKLWKQKMHSRRNGRKLASMSVTERLVEMGFVYKIKLNERQHEHLWKKTVRWKSNGGLWMNGHSALGKVTMFQLLFGAVPLSDEDDGLPEEKLQISTASDEMELHFS